MARPLPRMSPRLVKTEEESMRNIPPLLYLTMIHRADSAIETLLLIARAIVLVLFGHAIHALREEYSESAISVKEASELQQRIDAYHEQLQQIQTELQQHVREVEGSMSTLIQSAVYTRTHAIMT
jgi:hypothetical protein